MKLVVISPGTFRADEVDVLGRLFEAGLERYHVRKPRTPASELEQWLRALPEAWRPRLVLHTHHALVRTLRLGGRHHQDTPEAMAEIEPTGFTSRACHDLPTLRTALGHFDALLVSPIFASLSKPGHGPNGALPHDRLHELLKRRSDADRHTLVHAMGGVSAATLPACRALGFNGVAVLGAIWGAPDPLGAFKALLAAADGGGAAVSTLPPRHAA